MNVRYFVKGEYIYEYVLDPNHSSFLFASGLNRHHRYVDISDWNTNFSPTYPQVPDLYSTLLNKEFERV